MPTRFVFLAAALLGFVAPSARAQTPSAEPVSVVVDARDAARGKIFTTVSVAVKPGAVSLSYPRWIPGSHAPQGPLNHVKSLAFFASGTAPGGAKLTWRRDPLDAFSFVVDVPKDVRRIDARFEYVTSSAADEVYYGVAVSETVAVLNWNALLLAPSDAKLSVQKVRAKLLLPGGWRVSSALDSTIIDAAGEAAFPETTLETLIDSPAMLGAHKKSVALKSGDVLHALDYFTETPDTVLPDVFVARMNRLVAESGALFGSRPYPKFRFLLAVTERIGRSGLEHRTSTMNVLPLSVLGDRPARTIAYDSWRSWSDNLVPHEFVHSWNGKYRRPYGLMPSTAGAQLSTDLLWVYEGLTEYLGEVLMVRSGFRSAENWREDMRRRLLSMREGPGRDWQSLTDSAIAAPFVYVVGGGPGMRPTNDFYYESSLIWLEADAIIRVKTGGAKSLDDFCRVFFASDGDPTKIKSYTRADVISVLRSVCEFDWPDFLARRFDAPPTDSPSWGLTASGWDFAFSNRVPDFLAREAESDLRGSLGFRVGSGGDLSGIVDGSVAARAGLTRASKILGVNGALFSPSALRQAVRATGGEGVNPVELLVSEAGKYRIVSLLYTGGEKFLLLLRNESRPDLLEKIAAPVLP